MATSITSASGQKLEGVQVSAKKEGSTITTSVYTDQNGDYFFPAMADGKYQVWAQALSFHTVKGAVDLSAAKHQDFKLAVITDPADYDAVLNVLPANGTWKYPMSITTHTTTTPRMSAR